MENFVVATCTADNKYMYDALVTPSNGKRPKRLIDLAGDMNSFLEQKNGWNNYNQWPPVTRLGPGRWGTDINVCRIGRALELPQNSSIEEIAEAVHNGWADCFDYWYTNQPWKCTNLNEKKYIQPGKDLETRSKISRSKLKFDELDEFQKKMCRQMAEFIKNECM